jgi:hypothetical protein
MLHHSQFRLLLDSLSQFAVADLAGPETVAAKQMAEAVQYLSLGRNYWN